ncbi:MAG: nucleotidyltransferase family protein [Proteobacteria bacterium]|nr:nucleotidyltransferase family protein [Pseudomonadota bacterium]
MATALQQRLLHLCAAGIGDPQEVADLGATDWARLLVMARRHRLGPLLHSRLVGRPVADAGAPGIPKPFAEAIAANFDKHSRRAVELQAEVSRIQRIMRENEIPVVFLRGAFLAFHIYRQPGLRPMRDLDLLVPEDQVAEASRALRTSILRRPGRPAEQPVLRIDVEFHTRLAEQSRRCDPAFDAGTWNRLISRVVAEEEIWYLAPEDQLLHLILHTLQDNPRNCHPIVLTDIAQLLEQTGINWPQFWQQALVGNWSAGCWLLLNLAKHFYPAVSFQPPEDVELPPLPPDLGAVAATLTLGEPDERLKISRQLKLQVRNGPLQFVRELLGQRSRRLADVS